MPPEPETTTVTSVLELPSKLAINQLVGSESFRTLDQVLDTDGSTLTPLDFLVPPDLGSVRRVGILKAFQEGELKILYLTSYNESFPITDSYL